MALVSGTIDSLLLDKTQKALIGPLEVGLSISSEGAGEREGFLKS